MGFNLSIDEDRIVSFYSFASLVLLLYASRSNSVPVPQFIATVLTVAAFARHDDNITYGDVILNTVALFCVSVAVGLCLEGRDIKYKAAAGMTFFITGFLGLDIFRMAETAFFNETDECSEFAIFGLNEDIDWVTYQVAVQDQNYSRQSKSMKRLTEKYHPVYCPTGCRSVCTKTFSQIQELSHNLVKDKLD